MPETLLTVEDVAMRLRVGKTTVYELLDHGGLRAIKIGRCRRIPESTLNKWIVQQISAQSEHGAPERGCRAREADRSTVEQLGEESSCYEEGSRPASLDQGEWSTCLLARSGAPRDEGSVRVSVKDEVHSKTYHLSVTLSARCECGGSGVACCIQGEECLWLIALIG